MARYRQRWLSLVSLGLSLLRNHRLAAKDILLDLAGGCFSAAWPIGDVKSLKALHRYNVLKTPAVGGITAWKCPAALDFARRCFRQLGYEVNFLRRLEVRQMRR